MIVPMWANDKKQSPSPRRAWIEIRQLKIPRNSYLRRPPHGGRGLKSCKVNPCHRATESPSPRRAWIEIEKLSSFFLSKDVALPTEGVD